VDLAVVPLGHIKISTVQLTSDIHIWIYLWIYPWISISTATLVPAHTVRGCQVVRLATNEAQHFATDGNGDAKQV